MTDPNGHSRYQERVCTLVPTIFSWTTQTSTQLSSSPQAHHDRTTYVTFTTPTARIPCLPPDTIVLKLITIAPRYLTLFTATARIPLSSTRYHRSQYHPSPTTTVTHPTQQLHIIHPTPRPLSHTTDPTTLIFDYCSILPCNYTHPHAHLPGFSRRA